MIPVSGVSSRQERSRNGLKASRGGYALQGYRRYRSRRWGSLLSGAPLRAAAAFSIKKGEDPPMDNNAIQYKKRLLHCAVAAILGTSGAAAAVYAPRALAQETPDDADESAVEEVVVTGSRIVRRDLEV